MTSATSELALLERSPFVNLGRVEGPVVARKPCGQNLDHQRDIGAPRAAYECPVYVDTRRRLNRLICAKSGHSLTSW